MSAQQKRKLFNFKYEKLCYIYICVDKHVLVLFEINSRNRALNFFSTLFSSFYKCKFATNYLSIILLFYTGVITTGIRAIRTV